ncbi:MAG: alpha/beta hydrolase [Gordonia paraffinivorans]
MTAPTTDDVEIRRIAASDAILDVAVSGPSDARCVVLLHGWPHTWELWRPVGSALAAHGHRVIAPNLRGIGGGERPSGRVDAAVVAGDVLGVMTALGVETATVVGIDAGVPPAVYAAARAPSRVDRLVVMEGVLPGVPGAEKFFAAGPPWWFGFHAIPGLAETVVEGHEDDYLGWFLTGPSVRHDIGADARRAFVSAYRGKDALRAGFELYRASDRNARLFREAFAANRLTMPVLSVEGGVVGDALSGQLAGIADDLTCTTVPDCGHLIPLEKPRELTEALVDAIGP